jgi:hypothetical protein
VVGDHTDALRQESDEVTAKINGAYEKLASKLRRKADKAKGSMDAKKNDRKRALLRRRFELYADAANNLELRLAKRQQSQAPDSD